MSVGIKKLYYCTNVEACTYARSDHPFSKVSDVRHPVCEGLHEDGCGSALKIHVEDSRGTKLSFFAISVVVLLSAFWVVKQEFFPTPLTGIEFAQLQTKIDEADATLTLTLVRVDDAEGPLRVEYQTRDGSARAGSDYLASAGVVRFSSTEASKTITINILADDEDGEVEENFVVSLNNVLHTPEHLVVIRESSAALARAHGRCDLHRL